MPLPESVMNTDEDANCVKLRIVFLLSTEISMAALRLSSPVWVSYVIMSESLVAFLERLWIQSVFAALVACHSVLVLLTLILAVPAVAATLSVLGESEIDTGWGSSFLQELNVIANRSNRTRRMAISLSSLFLCIN